VTGRDRNLRALPLTDDEPPESHWAELSLIVEGPEVTDSKRSICIKEARAAGVVMKEHAAVAATLHLEKDANRILVKDGRPQWTTGNWKTNAACRVAIAVALNLDASIGISRDGRAPQRCAQVGTVEDDQRRSTGGRSRASKSRRSRNQSARRSDG
jgi:hypothetical protein